MTVKLTTDWWKTNKPKTLPTGGLEKAIKEWETANYIAENSPTTTSTQSAIEALDKVTREVSTLKKLCMPGVHKTTKGNLEEFEKIIKDSKPKLQKQHDDASSQDDAKAQQLRAVGQQNADLAKKQDKDRRDQAADAAHQLAQHLRAIETFHTNATKLHHLVETSAALKLTANFADKTLRLVEKYTDDLVALSKQSRAEVTKEIEQLGGPTGRGKPGYDQALAIIKKQTEITNLVVGAQTHLADLKKRLAEMAGA